MTPRSETTLITESFRQNDSKTFNETMQGLVKDINKMPVIVCLTSNKGLATMLRCLSLETNHPNFR